MVLDLVLESGLPEMTQASNLLYQIREGQKYIVVLDLVWTYTGLIEILYRKTPISILLIEYQSHLSFLSFSLSLGDGSI